MAVLVINCDGVHFGQDHTTSNETVFIPRGIDFFITSIDEDTDTGDVFYTVESKKLGKTVTFQIPKKDAIDKTRVLKYACLGLDVNDSNVSIVPEVFSMKEENYIDLKKPVGLCHSIAGVKESFDAQGHRSFIFAGQTNPLTQSKYIGHLNLKPSGNAEDWFDFVKREIKDSVEISFIISLAFAAILHAVLADVADIDNFVVHIRGDSSSGKTTMLCLAASVFGPGTEKDPAGIISTWNATKNALLRRLMKVNGILMGLDEVSMNREKDFTGLLYSISSGIEKDRLTRDAQVQDRLIGRYILLSTGEASLLAKTNGNIGLAMRVLEFDGHQWTSSAEQSERIKRFVKSNYGHAATEFGLVVYHYMLIVGMEGMLAEFEMWRQFYCDNCEIQIRKERMSSRYGIILWAAALANEFLDMKIDIEKLCDFMIQNENDGAEGRNDYNNVYDRIVSCIVINKAHFDDHTIIRNKGTKKGSQELNKYDAIEPWGEFKDLNRTYEMRNGMTSTKTVVIDMEAFDRIITKELDYEDSRAIRKYLKDKGFLICEKDRDFCRKMFRGTRTKMVEMYLPTDDFLDKDAQDKYVTKLIEKDMEILTNMETAGMQELKDAVRELERYKDRIPPFQLEIYNRCRENLPILSKKIDILKKFEDEEDE